MSFLICKPLKLIDQFINLISNVPSPEININILTVKEWTAREKLSTNKNLTSLKTIRQEFFQNVALYAWTTWTLSGEKTLDGNPIRMLNAFWNKSWKQNQTKQQLYGHLPPSAQIIQVKRTLLGEWVRNHIWHSRLELSYTWTYERRLTSKNLRSSSLYEH